MDLSLFDYSFPKELVAQHPLPRREDSRMMVIHRETKNWEHRKVPDLLSYLREGDVLVLNNALADLVERDGRLVPPLPPYIKRKNVEEFTSEDIDRYRNVYASAPGSKAAPTAGFHLSESLLDAIQDKGVTIHEITLHVSYDTYKPIRSDNILDHPMHGESFEIPESTAEAIRKAKEENRRVIAVGTTTVRALESWALNINSACGDGRNELHPYKETTNLFIIPGFQFQIVDALLTNFHRPRSTVLVMVSSFAGREVILRTYEEAIRERYRLFSYGDCMLIL